MEANTLKRNSIFGAFLSIIALVAFALTLSSSSKPLFTFPTAAATGMIQQTPQLPAKPAPADQPILRAFPPQQSADYETTVQEIAVHSARLEAARAKSQTILFQVAFKLQMKEAEAENCTALKNQNGAWVFSCPPTQKKEDAPVKSGGDAPTKPDKAGQ